MVNNSNIFYIIPSFLFIASLFVGCSNNSKKESALAKLDSSHIQQAQVSEPTIDSTKYRRGKSLFMQECGACHSGKDKTDNYLEGIVKTVGVNYLKLYLTKQDSLVRARDKYALNVKEKFGNMGNSHNFKCSDDALEAIIEYLK